MKEFPIHTVQNAPEHSRATLQAVEAKVGFVPNVFGLYAATPAGLDGLTELNAAFDAASFSALEREVIALTTSVFNACPYCVAGHSTFAVALGLDDASLARIRDGGVASDPRLGALSRVTIDLLRTRGGLDEAQLRSFVDDGFTPHQLLELLLGVACNLMTNFASKTTRLPLDEAFQRHAWTPRNSLETTAA